MVEHLETAVLSPSLLLLPLSSAPSHSLTQPGDCDELAEQFLISTTDSTLMWLKFPPIPTLVGNFPLGKGLEAACLCLICPHTVSESVTGHCCFREFHPEDQELLEDQTEID